MKRFLSAILLSIAICCTCTSCFTAMMLLTAHDDDISRDRSYLNLTIFQTLSDGEALAFTANNDVVKVISYTDVYYDGKKIHGNFRLIGTYKYITKNEIEKTVPVYILESEYQEQTKI